MTKQALRLTGAGDLISRGGRSSSSLEGVPTEALAPAANVPSVAPPPVAPVSSAPVLPVAEAEKKTTQTTTVRLDEDLYIRLCDAGRPRPGQPKRKQNEIMVEALEEWLKKRGL